MATLFGTDGIRGKANQYPITADIAIKTGQAVGRFVRDQGFSSIIIGKDTRLSGDMLESGVASGIASTGVDVSLAGVIPTPGIAYLTRITSQTGAGVMISASHNPYTDNGIKIFRHDGMKLDDEEEHRIESWILSQETDHGIDIGSIRVRPELRTKYIDFLRSLFPKWKQAEAVRIVLDCSHGAASGIAKEVFHGEGIETTFIYNAPNGKNINDGCGSQHTQDLSRQVLALQADIGFAFDGDADRMIAVDSQGREITGDAILAICAKFAKQKNQLKNNTLVSTIMSNVGLSNTLTSLDIQHLTADVGDKRVLELMKQSNACIGGEDSGHFIFLDHHTTGDGMLSAIKLLEVMNGTGQSLSELASIMTVFPQVLMNVEVDPSKPDFKQVDAIQDEIERVETALGNKGRVLIRYSGTQPLLRVMVEGPEKDLTQAYAAQICKAIQLHLPKMN